MQHFILHCLSLRNDGDISMAHVVHFFLLRLQPLHTTFAGLENGRGRLLFIFLLLIFYSVELHVVSSIVLPPPHCWQDMVVPTYCHPSRVRKIHFPHYPIQSCVPGVVWSTNFL